MQSFCLPLPTCLLPYPSLLGAMLTNPQPRSAISGGTGVALSVVLSLLVAAFSAGITRGVVDRLQQDVLGLQAESKASTAAQHLQALELATLRTELRVIRESQLRVEAALGSGEPRPSQRSRQ